ncbi:ABC transporter ATP-binding protein [Paenibacillus marchantiophytorum]|uniref:ABC transporter ATP-binding protein n=1 Tax=Paenibacillus marchantiophytorum TaxID=1619310 RepID=A0ABQ2BN35_9BACL|nr:ABC transporter ATP-binding protein [Paenibacillus marchantiophytorum]GGI43572.1 ABC transporter ATP-binding protein [Paenibacillus marchantiophytorum]
MKSIIQLDQVTKEFKGKPAVDDLSLTINAGSVVALLGPNGAGKTTAVSMMLGLLQPTKGKIRILDGHPQDKAVRNRMGAMLQDVNVIDGLTVLETIDLFRHYYSNPLPLHHLLHISGLESEKNKRASALSGGQKRRLGFALALAGDPELLFLDEPTVGMDITARQQFWETVRTMAAKGRTIILTTHYLEEADSIADRIVVINKGRLIADGTSTEIKASTNRKTILFTAGANLTEDQLSSLPSVGEVVWSGRKVKITSPDTDEVIFAMIQRQLDIKDIEIHAGGLEDAFQFLVQQ